MNLTMIGWRATLWKVILKGLLILLALLMLTVSICGAVSGTLAMGRTMRMMDHSYALLSDEYAGERFELDGSFMNGFLCPMG